SAHPNGDCKIKNGKFQGMTLSGLWKEHQEVFGNVGGDVFPLLTKIIDAKQDLSIQVHPDDCYAKEYENGSLGKMECWYVLDCKEDATIVIGHHAQSKEELKDMIAENRWKELIREIPIKKGDFFQINPGCVHAIKGGTMILETQQNSDITYRLYDYDRLSNGKKRELHIDKSIDVIQVPFSEVRSEEKGMSANSWLEELIHCPRYTVWKGQISGEETFIQDRKFMLVSIIEGEGSFGNTPVKIGDHFIVPYNFGKVEVTGNFTCICSAV
ncbi:MAG: mannose-6-phosphate isomerase, class I, partial [Lachnospiraceae bacterium]